MGTAQRLVRRSLPRRAHSRRGGDAISPAAASVPATDVEHADFLIDYTLASGPLVQTIVTPGAYPLVGVSGGAYLGALPASMTYVYSDNQLMLDFIDPRSNKVFWHGAAAFSTDKPIEVSTSKATKAVDKIMRKYPAPQLASASRPTG